MIRLIDADAVREFPYSETSGTEDMIDSWIEEAGFDKVTQCEFEDKLHKLCKLVIDGMINIIDTEPTAYDVDKVVEKLNNRIANLDNINKLCMDNGGFNAADRIAGRMSEVIESKEIVKAGGKE